MFGPVLDKLMRRQDLTVEEAAATMSEIVDGTVTPAQTAALLIGLAMKGERPAEIVGFARTMRERAIKLSAAYPDAVDLCGTGGDRSGTFNISSVASIVVAACGVRVAKHGNRSVSSRCGSADVFEALGVKTVLPPAAVEQSLKQAGIAFLFAPVFHPSMKHAAAVRREIGVRTAFNLLGPLTNPVLPSRQLVGVPRPELTELLARALQMLGSERAWVVHGADGIDEISTTGYTKISECWKGTVHTFYVHPADFGLSKAAPPAIWGGDAAVNAAVARAVLNGTKGAPRDVVLLNAGSALFIAGHVPSVEEGIRAAARAIDSGDAARTLEKMAGLSAGTEVA